MNSLCEICAVELDVICHDNVLFDRYCYLVDWSTIFKKKKFKILTLERVNKFIDWVDVSYHQVLNEEFITKHIDKIVWNGILEKQKLSDEFLETHIDKINWNELSKNKYISDKFIEKYKENLNWRYVCMNEKSEYFLNKMKDYLEWDKVIEQDLSEKFIIKNLNMISQFKFQLSLQKLSIDFIKKHRNLIKMEGISLNRKITDDVIIFYKNEIDWTIRSCLRLSDRILYECKDKINWKISFPKLDKNQKLLYKEYYIKSFKNN